MALINTDITIPIYRVQPYIIIRTLGQISQSINGLERREEDLIVVNNAFVSRFYHVMQEISIIDETSDEYDPVDSDKYRLPQIIDYLPMSIYNFLCAIKVSSTFIISCLSEFKHRLHPFSSYNLFSKREKWRTH